LGVYVSDDTVLRQLKQSVETTANPPRVIGIDDWSWRKSQTYGTIIVDLERHTVIDILADRSVESCANGCASALRLKSSAGIVAAFMRRQQAKGHRRLCKLLTGSILSIICAKPLKSR
jgi:transposase